MQWCVAINMEIQLLFTDEPVDIEKWPVQVQDFRQIFNHFMGYELRISTPI